MKITVPQDIEIKELTARKDAEGNSQQGKTLRKISFSEYVIEWVIGDPAIGKTAKDWIRAKEIYDKVKDAKAGEELEITGDHHAAMKKVLEEPQGQTAPLVALQLIEFYQAILKAE